ncbi:MAG: regulatory iron-sulfur-containing complex subunit RicT [Candidatus Fimivivens sp.]
MSEVIGVKFKEGGKVYYFDPNGNTATADEAVIVETARGLECGVVAVANREVAEEEIVKPLKQVVRLATAKDVAQMEENRKREAHAFEVCQQKILDHKMDMKLVDVEYTFDNSKILFYFTADGRVDFRDLVKDLAGVFRTRIELRQIGVRDEAKMLGGLGICGRVFCCSSFLSDFQPVSIKMAKEQGLSLNPTKISGTCGRLMCCLKYEQNAYEDLLRTTPRVGTAVSTPEGPGTVSEIVNLLTGNLKIKIESGDAYSFKNFMKHEVKLLREDNRPARESRNQPPPQAVAQERDKNGQGEPKGAMPRRKENAPRRENSKPPVRGSRSAKRPEPKPTPQNKQPTAPAPESDNH